ncbi:unnamed protein product [marine sediment metagenome]|uniref:ABC transporter domain-containing protein n=1 Tax=marine sediment metagenome TaxID=412755 RepID=X1P1V4_9ZZZZ
MKLLVNRTGIIVAHRLATLEKVDDILILEKGRVIEQGTRINLAKDPNSHFYHLLKTGNIEEWLK